MAAVLSAKSFSSRTIWLKSLTHDRSFKAKPTQIRVNAHTHPGTNEHIIFWLFYTCALKTFCKYSKGEERTKKASSLSVMCVSGLQLMMIALSTDLHIYFINYLIDLLVYKMTGQSVKFLLQLPKTVGFVFILLFFLTNCPKVHFLS